MLARTCIPEWQGVTPGRYRSTQRNEQGRGRRNLALRGFSAYEIRLRTLKWFAGYAKSKTIVFDSECHLDSDYSSSRSLCSDGVEENVAGGGKVLNIVNRSLDYEVRGGSRLERSGFVSLDNVSAEIGDGEELGLDDVEYYVPEIGHRVLGVVVSGSRTKFSVDIGAAQLGELKVTQLFPLDRFQVKHNKWMCPEAVDADYLGKFSRPPHGRPCMVYDDEVFGFEDPALFIIDIGTVLELMVIGLSVSGIPLLSARRAAQRNAWNRVKQIKELSQPIQVEVMDCNTSGVLAKVEGLRAFLPLKEFLNRPKTLADYMGRKLWVTVVFADEGCNSLVISERKAWVRRNLRPGSLHDGTVIEILPYGVRVQVNRTNVVGLIHISNIAHALIEKVTDVFEVREQIKMMVVNSFALNTISFSTADLESEQGLMLRDKQRVFQEAERTAHAWWVANQSSKESQNHDAEELCTQAAPLEPIANLDWLDFGGNSSLV